MPGSNVPKKAYKNPDFLHSEEARTIRILSEYLEPTYRFDEFKINNTILFLGSARANPDDKNSPLYRYYWDAEQLAFLLAEWAISLKPRGKNFVICTGGGPGIMEAANRGATRAGGLTIGLNISLPHEQAPNPYISSELNMMFHYFFMRKFFLLNRARAIMAFPGGFGTLDELFEVLTLVQTDKIHRDRLYILLYGKEYWDSLINFKELIRRGTISPDDLSLFRFVSSPEEAFAFLQSHLPRFLPIENNPKKSPTAKNK